VPHAARHNRVRECSTQAAQLLHPFAGSLAWPHQSGLSSTSIFVGEADDLQRIHAFWQLRDHR
jgi:hypothetical protein